MRKKLYDISWPTGLIIAFAYLFLFTLLIFILTNSEKSLLAIILLVLLGVSLAFFIWYYFIMAATITDKGITQGRKFIDKKDLKWKVVYNARYRYQEIIFYNKYHNLERMLKQERKRKTIVVQWFKGYERFLKDYEVKNERQPEKNE